MPNSKKPGVRRVRNRRSVSIGGVSQSAFAGYATTGGQQHKNKEQKSEEQTGKDQQGKDQKGKEQQGKKK